MIEDNCANLNLHFFLSPIYMYKLPDFKLDIWLIHDEFNVLFLYPRLSTIEEKLKFNAAKILIICSAAICK